MGGKGSGDRLASGGISATFIPDKTIKQEAWDESFKGVKTRKQREKIKKNEIGCWDCDGSWATVTEFHAHIPTCGVA